MLINRREFFKNNLSLCLVGSLILNHKNVWSNIPQGKKGYVVGGNKLEFVVYDMGEKKTTTSELPFKGHSYVQNPLHPRHIIILQKGGPFLAVVDLISHKQVKVILEPGYRFYGHSTFSEDKTKFYVPRSHSKNANSMELLVYDSKSYEKIDSIPMNFSITHEIVTLKNNILGMATNGYMDKDKSKNGLLFFDLTTRKALQFIEVKNTELYMTHLLAIGDSGDFILSGEIPKSVATNKKTFEKKMIFKGEVYHLSTKGDGKSTLIKLPSEVELKLKENISNFVHDKENKIIYFENLAGDTIFVTDDWEMKYIRHYDISTAGLCIYQGKLFISGQRNTDSNKDKVITNLSSLISKKLTNTHFSVAEL